MSGPLHYNNPQYCHGANHLSGPLLLLSPSSFSNDLHSCIFKRTYNPTHPVWLKKLNNQKWLVGGSICSVTIYSYATPPKYDNRRCLIRSVLCQLASFGHFLKCSTETRGQTTELHFISIVVKNRSLFYTYVL